MAISHYVEFLKGQNFIWRGSLEDRGTSPCQILSKLGYPSRRYCDFSKWPSPPSWIFEFAKFYRLTGPGAKMHYYAKLSQKREIRCGDIEVFRTFKMAVAVILDFWIHESITWLSSYVRDASSCKIGQYVAEILRFSVFLKMAAVSHLVFVWDIFGSPR